MKKWRPIPLPGKEQVREAVADFRDGNAENAQLDARDYRELN
jgi:hypothetical protein